MAYEMVMPYHLHMPSYFLETFTEYPYVAWSSKLTYFFCLVIPVSFHLLFPDKPTFDIGGCQYGKSCRQADSRKH